MTLSLRRGDEVRELACPLPPARASTLARRAYGAVAAAQLEELGEAAEPLAAVYARHYRVVGRTCSLVMLERERDYEDQRIRQDQPARDAARVRAHPAGREVEAIALELAEAVRDPRARTLRLVERQSSVSPFLLRASLALGPEAFEVTPRALRCEARGLSAVGSDCRAALRSPLLDAARLSAEAALRRSAPDALRLLSSLVERSPRDPSVLREVGFAAAQRGFPGHAYLLLRRALEQRPWERHTYAMMARCLEQLERPELALLHYEFAAEGREDWGRSPRRAERLAFARLLRQVRRGGGALASLARRRLSRLEDEVLIPSQLDLVVMLEWTTDRTDVDLYLQEPSGEVCSYRKPLTTSGACYGEDVQGGFGPEVIELAEAPPGDYEVRVHCFRGDRNRASTRTRVLLTVIEGWGTPRERVRRESLALRTGGEPQRIARLRLP